MPHDPVPVFYTDLHMYRWPDGVEVHVEDFKDSTETFSCLVSAYWRADATRDDPVVIDDDRLNFLASRSVSGLAKSLAGQCGRGELPAVSETVWKERLKYVGRASRVQFRNGSEPLLRAGEIVVDFSVPSYLVPPLVAGSGATLWIADSSAGKSMLATALGVSVASGHPVLGITPTKTGPVIFYDWEDNEETWEERVEAICKGAGIEIPSNYLYRRLTRTLVSGSVRIRRESEEEGAILVIVDSIGESLGADPSKPEFVLPAMNVLKQLPCPVLGLHHISAEQAKSSDLRDVQKGYGSVYIRSAARLQWFIKRFQEEEADTGDIYMHNTKVNRGKKSRALAWTVTYENGASGHLEALRYDTRSASDYFDRLREDTPAEDLTISDAIIQILEAGNGDAYSHEGLLKHVTRLRGRETTIATIRSKVAELVRRGIVIKVEGKEGGSFYGLRSREF